MRLSLTGPVGIGSENNVDNVRIISALLYVWLRSLGKSILAIKSSSDDALTNSISDFQKDVVKLPKQDGRVDPNGRTWQHLLSTLKATRTTVAITKPAKGGLTFDAEGLEGSFLHSRILHVPTHASGLTLGRGYDMKDRKQADVTAELVAAGISSEIAGKISLGARKKGLNAFKFISEQDLLDFEITAAVQLKLFETVYKRYEKDVLRLCNKADTAKRYGIVSWDILHYKIKDVLVDLHYRGDYGPSCREVLQDHVVDNDLKKFTEVIVNQSNWLSVPADRFLRRKNYLNGS